MVISAKTKKITALNRILWSKDNMPIVFFLRQLHIFILKMLMFQFSFTYNYCQMSIHWEYMYYFLYTDQIHFCLDNRCIHFLFLFQHFSQNCQAETIPTLNIVKLLKFIDSLLLHCELFWQSLTLYSTSVWVSAADLRWLVIASGLWAYTHLALKQTIRKMESFIWCQLYQVQRKF